MITPKHRAVWIVTVVLLMGLIGATEAYGDPTRALRDQIPPPPPPPAWTGVAWTPAPVTAPAAAPPPSLPAAQPMAPQSPAPRLERCPPTADCGLRRDACCWPLDRCGQRYGRFQLRVEATLTGIASPSGALGGIESGLPGQMDWSVLDYGSDLADAIRGRVALSYAFSPTTRLEARGGWYGSWQSTAPAAGVFAFFPGPAGMGGVSTPNTATFSAEADLYTGELTLWNELVCSGCWRFDWGIGAGAVRFDEKAQAHDWGATFPGFNAPAFVGSDVENLFLAGQIGGQVHYALSESFELSFRALGRIGSMESDVRVDDRSFFGPGDHTQSRSGSNLAFGGLLELGARWRLTSRLALTAGYSLMLTDGVVRAYEAMDFTQSNTGAVGAALRRSLLTSHTVFVGFELNL